MDGDIRPLAPISSAHALQAAVDLDVMHGGCVVLGNIGLALVAILKVIGDKRAR